MFTLWTPVYATITAVCTIMLYVSYVIPAVLGARALGRSWREVGPWNLGRWYRPLAIVGAIWTCALMVIGMQSPNEKSIAVMAGSIALLTLAWAGLERRRFAGPPRTLAAGEEPAT